MSTKLIMEFNMQHLHFELTGDYIELNNLLKIMGIVDSGGAGKMLVAKGNVFVDAKQELRKTCKIRADQRVTLGDISIIIKKSNAK